MSQNNEKAEVRRTFALTQEDMANLDAVRKATGVTTDSAAFRAALAMCASVLTRNPKANAGYILAAMGLCDFLRKEGGGNNPVKIEILDQAPSSTYDVREAGQRSIILVMLPSQLG